MADPLAIELAPAAARTASGSGDVVDIGERRSCLKLALDASEVLGDPGDRRLTATIETSTTGAGGWKRVGIFPTRNTDGPEDELVVAGCRRFVRASWTVTGVGASFTFALSGTAHVLYAEPRHLSRYGAPAAALEDLDDGQKAASCLAATDAADACFARRYTLPLISWPDEVIRNCAMFATADAMAVRGQDTDGPDELVVMRGSAADKWFREVGAGTRSPPGIVDSTPTRSGSAPRVSSRRSRGGRGWHEDDC